MTHLLKKSEITQLSPPEFRYEETYAVPRAPCSTPAETPGPAPPYRC